MPVKPQGRTRCGNGKTLWLEEFDQRGVIPRRFKELFAQIVEDGALVSEAQIQIARRASALAVWCESCEAQLAQGAELDIAAFTTASNTLRRLFETLGIKRAPKDITPTLSNYLRSKQAAPSRVRREAAE